MRRLFSNVRSKQKGFSLVELMVVIGIIGILATLAVPRFQTFQAKARFSEAKIMLSQIATLQDTYYNDNSAYINMTAYGKGTCARPAGATSLGFLIEPCTGVVPRFEYSVTGASATAFVANANTTTVNTVCNTTANLLMSLDNTRTVAGAINCP